MLKILSNGTSDYQPICEEIDGLMHVIQRYGNGNSKIKYRLIDLRVLSTFFNWNEAYIIVLL